MNILDFPRKQPEPLPALSHPHPAVQREAHRIEAWVEFAQRSLSRLQGVAVEDQRLLRQIGNRLLERLTD